VENDLLSLHTGICSDIVAVGNARTRLHAMERLTEILKSQYPVQLLRKVN